MIFLLAIRHDPCLFIRIINVAGKMIVVVTGIFVDDLLVTKNYMEEFTVTAVKEIMNGRYVLTVQG